MPNRRVARALAGASLTLLALAACVPRATPPAPIPAPPPRVIAMPSPPPAAPRPAQAPPLDWESAPLSPGDWSYSPSPSSPLATFESDRASFTIRCQQGRTIWLGVTGVQGGGALVIRTSYGMRRLPADRGHVYEVVVSLPAGDALLEQMAFSRGRILVTVEGGPSLVVPAWPEIGRVIEDCRGQ